MFREYNNKFLLLQKTIKTIFVYICFRYPESDMFFWTPDPWTPAGPPDPWNFGGPKGFVESGPTNFNNGNFQHYLEPFQNSGPPSKFTEPFQNSGTPSILSPYSDSNQSPIDFSSNFMRFFFSLLFPRI
jgi:hypothetical protein